MRLWLILLAAAILSGCAADPSAEVRLGRATRGDLEVGFTASGRVRARQVRVAAGVSGRILRIMVRENEKVQRGQALATLDSREARSEVEALQAEREGARGREVEAATALRLKESELANQVRQARAGEEAALARLARASEARPEDRAAAQAALDAAGARLRRAEAELERSRKLFEQDILSRLQFDEAQAEVESALAALRQSQAELRQVEPRESDLRVPRAELSQARAQVAAAESGQGAELSLYQDRLRGAEVESRRVEAHLRSALARLDRYTVKAPQDGVVFQLLFEPGEVVDWGNPLLTLVSPGDLRVEAEVDEQDAARVALSMPVEVAFSSLPGQSFAGRVEQVATALEPRARGPAGSKVLRVDVKLDAPPPSLRDGLEAVVEGNSVLARDVLLLPSSAVYRQDGRDYVTAVRDGKAARLPVQVGAASSERVEIKGGLDSGTDVVLEGGDRLAEGTLIGGRP